MLPLNMRFLRQFKRLTKIDLLNKESKYSTLLVLCIYTLTDEDFYEGFIYNLYTITTAHTLM